MPAPPKNLQSALSDRYALELDEDDTIAELTGLTKVGHPFTGEDHVLVVEDDDE